MSESCPTESSEPRAGSKSAGDPKHPHPVVQAGEAESASSNRCVVGIETRPWETFRLWQKRLEVERRRSGSPRRVDDRYLTPVRSQGMVGGASADLVPSAVELS